MKSGNPTNGQDSGPRLNSLEIWLGIRDATRESVDQRDKAFEERLRTLRAMPLKRDNMAAQKSWNGILSKIQAAESEITLLGRILGAFRKPVLWAPALAAITVTVFLGWYFFRSDTPFFLELENAGRLTRVDLTKDAFTAKPDFPVQAHLPFTALTLKNVTGLHGSRTQNAIRLFFESGKMLVAYTRSGDRPELVIQTPKAEYSVVGTRFLIDSQKDKDDLAVREGKVQVKSGSTVKQVSAGETWNSQTPELVLKNPKNVEDAFENLLQAPHGSDKPRPKQEAKITIHTVNGEILSGTLKSETKVYIEIRIHSPAKILKISKAEIAKVDR